MTAIKFLLTLSHVLACVILIVVILMQAAKGGGLSGTFGGSSAGTFFGPRSAGSALSKITQYLAVGFLVMSFALSMIAGAGSTTRSVTQDVLKSSPASGLPPVESIEFGSPAVPGTQQAQPDVFQIEE